MLLVLLLVLVLVGVVELVVDVEVEAGVDVDVVVVTEVVGGEVVGVTGLVPRDGVAEQVVTCRPAVKEARASGPRGSEGSSGTLPT